jgi:hypothetical protein
VEVDQAGQARQISARTWAVGGLTTFPFRVAIPRSRDVAFCQQASLVFKTPFIQPRFHGKLTFTQLDVSQTG